MDDFKQHSTHRFVCLWYISINSIGCWRLPYYLMGTRFDVTECPTTTQGKVNHPPPPPQRDSSDEPHHLPRKERDIIFLLILAVKHSDDVHQSSSEDKQPVAVSHPFICLILIIILTFGDHSSGNIKRHTHWLHEGDWMMWGRKEVVVVWSSWVTPSFLFERVSPSDSIVCNAVVCFKKHS